MAEPDYEYVVYVDEAGDPGLKAVRPVDPKGASEWLILAAVLVRRERVGFETRLVTDILNDIGVRQRKFLHFRDLGPTRKSRVCQIIAMKPFTFFVVASNKKNMKGHRNPNAERISSKQWFYNWLTRILIERISDFVERDSIENFGAPRFVKFEFSERGGQSYSSTAAYVELMSEQSRRSLTKLQKWVPKWTVLDHRLVSTYPPKERAGLQIADTVASAFYQAVDNLETGPCDPSYAKALMPRVAYQGNQRFSDYGVVLQPTPATAANLSPDQQEIFDFYGYGFE